MLESKKDYAQAKLIDLGTALYMKDKEQYKNQFIGTLSYIAPEIFKREGYDKPIDMWACGVICYQVIHAELPFPGHFDKQVMTQVCSGEY